MKKFIIPAIAASALFLSSCSTTQLASQVDSDDVYYTTAKAKVIEVPVAQTQTVAPDDRSYRTDEELYGGRDYTDRGFDDTYRYGYASRLDRFYYNSPGRTYYDYNYGSSYYPWYSYQYDPFFYDSWNYRPGMNLWVGINSFPRSMYGYNYGYYGSGYGYMGPYSYYNTYPGYGYGYGNGGYYYGGGAAIRPSNPRPNRESGVARGGRYIDGTQNNGGTMVPSGVRPSRGSAVSDRNSTPSRTSSEASRPAAQPSRESSRPSRTQESQPRQAAPRQEAPSRPERSYTPPPSSSGNSSGSSSGSSGGSSSGSRPSRR